MDRLDERFLIYTALATVCAFVSTFSSLGAGLWSFLQAVAVIELIYWVGLPRVTEPGDDARTF